VGIQQQQHDFFNNAVVQKYCENCSSQAEEALGPILYPGVPAGLLTVRKKIGNPGPGRLFFLKEMTCGM
jgi:hypothetical protein